MIGEPRLILASGSRARRDMLSAAGVTFTVQAADIDEAAMRSSLAAEHGDDIVPPEDVAEILAIAKAEAVSAIHPEAFVIGSDQVLALHDEIFTKPEDAAAAKAQLERLRGATHRLYSAVALVRGGEVLFAEVDAAYLTMRNFSDTFLAAYLTRVGDAVTSSVGAYQLESAGIQLFEAVDGDYFTILGMPLLPLLGELRRQGVIAD